MGHPFAVGRVGVEPNCVYGLGHKEGQQVAQRVRVLGNAPGEKVLGVAGDASAPVFACRIEASSRGCRSCSKGVDIAPVITHQFEFDDFQA
jgi:hypothetical protein